MKNVLLTICLGVISIISLVACSNIENQNINKSNESSTKVEKSAPMSRTRTKRDEYFSKKLTVSISPNKTEL